MSIKNQKDISLKLNSIIQQEINKSDKSLNSIKEILNPYKIKNTYYMIKKDLG